MAQFASPRGDSLSSGGTTLVGEEGAKIFTRTTPLKKKTSRPLVKRVCKIGLRVIAIAKIRQGSAIVQLTAPLQDYVPNCLCV